MTTIPQIVANELTNASEQYLLEIVDHGIHNITNQFNGDNDAEFAAEFERQAQDKLVELDGINMEVFGMGPR